MVFFILGIVILNSFVYHPAPSISAASYNSFGTPCKPAKSIKAKKGIPCQIIVTITLGKAVFVCDKKGIFVSINPILIRISFNTPKFPS